MKVKHLLLLSCVGFPLVSLAQDTAPEDVAVLRQLNQSSSTVFGFDISDRSTIGTPYLNDTWATGWVLSQSGKKFNGIPVMFNVAESIVLIKDKEGKAVQLDPAQIVQFGFDDAPVSVFAFQKVDLNGSNAFVQELYSGKKAKLWLEYRKVLFKAPKSNDPYVANKRDRYEADNQLWVVRDGQPQKVKRSVPALAEALGANPKELKAYVKKFKLKLSNSSDLVKIMEYHNTL